MARGNRTDRARRAGDAVDERIEDALLALLGRTALADVTVSALARAAHVSRSTFYQHFGNVDDVYRNLVKRFKRRSTPVLDQLLCADGAESATSAVQPFCCSIRNAGSYKPVVAESRFLDAFFEGEEQLPTNRDLYDMLCQAGLDEAQAKAVCAFQLNGCYAVARLSAADDAEWERVRRTLDTFIRGGVAACLSHADELGR
ncbi:MAG: TetR/AcrR family transcriptional regulator [Eggerthellaceae bacterium]